VSLRTVLPGLAALSAAVALSACGGQTLQDDLFVQRTGSGPGANLSLVVNDAGTASCNRRPPVPISGPQLIQARYIQMTMAPQAQAGLTLKPGPDPVFHYLVRTPDGQVSFADDSKGQPSIFSQLMLLTLQIAQQDCHLAM
jgi:hypothetical protein